MTEGISVDGGWKNSVEVHIREDLPRVFIEKRLWISPSELGESAKALAMLADLELYRVAKMLIWSPERSPIPWALNGVECALLFPIELCEVQPPATAEVRMLLPLPSSIEDPVATRRYQGAAGHDPLSGVIGLPLPLSEAERPALDPIWARLLLESVGASAESTQSLRRLNDPDRFVVSNACLQNILVAHQEEIPGDVLARALEADPQQDAAFDEAAPSYRYWVELGRDTSNEDRASAGPKAGVENPKTPGIWYEFRNALHAGNHAHAEALLESTPDLIRMRNGIGETVLHYLAVENDLDSVRWLSERGADLDTKNDFDTPVVFEVAQVEHRDLFAWFVASGVDLTSCDAEGQNLIEHLAEYGKNEMAAWVRASDAWARTNPDT